MARGEYVCVSAGLTRARSIIIWLRDDDYNVGICALPVHCQEARIIRLSDFRGKPRAHEVTAREKVFSCTAGVYVMYIQGGSRNIYRYAVDFNCSPKCLCVRI